MGNSSSSGIAALHKDPPVPKHHHRGPQPFRCAGAYADPIGLYKLGHRYYDPTLGRFTQPDPSATKPTPTSTPTATPSRTGPDGAVQLT
ncbi:RHS repeat-associated core domain-containing protein [Streptomyces sp. NPDC093554]|uniref:RHS repeat-associated core domain-containing protein n=1 Tax=Streptomyces sp. NPDC093554 TaxID=3155074 RepID=UPI00345063EB